MVPLLPYKKLIKWWPNTFVLVSWGLSLFQINSTLIGSGVTLFLLNSIAMDINQSLISLDIVQIILMVVPPPQITQPMANPISTILALKTMITP
jgi:hypothetical protein